MQTTLRQTAVSTSPSSAECFTLIADFGAMRAFKGELEKIAAGSSGRYDADDILLLLARGDMQLWALAAGGELKLVLVTEFIRWPRRYGLTIFGAVGKDPRSWMAHIGKLKDFALANDADLLCGWMRRGYGRITGWPETHRLYELDLRDAKT